MSTNADSLEKYLSLPDGRTLAYTDAGNTTNSTIVIFFHGAFGIGDARNPQRILIEKGVHFVAPTLQGWGKSSPRDKGVPYHVGLAWDVTQLIEHLHPGDKSDLKIYISGGSYGTVPAQVLYGAPFDIFPLGSQVKGCMLLAPFSPFREHKDYGAKMTMGNYIMVGAPSQYLPFHFVPWLAKAAIGRKFKTEAGAEEFVRKTIFDKMDDEEKALFAKWREENGRAEGQVEKDFGRNMFKSVQDTWDGFMELSDIVNGDWGYSVGGLDEDHCSEKRPIFIVSSEGDVMAPDAMAKWLAATYRKAHHRSITGGHLAGLYRLNDLWTEFLEMC